MRKIRTIIATLLIAMFTLGVLNVSTAGQKDRLRQKVRALNERVVALEDQASATDARLASLETRTAQLTDDGAYAGVVTNKQVWSFECGLNDAPKWDTTWPRDIPRPAPGAEAHLGCEQP